MPNALDVLCVCVSAGLSLDQAMQKVGQTFDNPIGEEFSRVISEVDLGITRKEALRNMQSRVEIPQLSSFIAIIIQSESIGMSISDVLQSQADQMRILSAIQSKRNHTTPASQDDVSISFINFPSPYCSHIGSDAALYSGTSWDPLIYYQYLENHITDQLDDEKKIHHKRSPSWSGKFP